MELLRVILAGDASSTAVIVVAARECRPGMAAMWQSDRLAGPMEQSKAVSMKKKPGSAAMAALPGIGMSQGNQLSSVRVSPPLRVPAAR
jgi:hypothetical protein